jgi:hypothetical protein
MIARERRKGPEEGRGKRFCAEIMQETKASKCVDVIYLSPHQQGFSLTTPMKSRQSAATANIISPLKADY